jgi:hypothetical protein
VDWFCKSHTETDKLSPQAVTYMEGVIVHTLAYLTTRELINNQLSHDRIHCWSSFLAMEASLLPCVCLFLTELIFIISWDTKCIMEIIITIWDQYDDKTYKYWFQWTYKIKHFYWQQTSTLRINNQIGELHPAK